MSATIPDMQSDKTYVCVVGWNDLVYTYNLKVDVIGN